MVAVFGGCSNVCKEGTCEKLMPIPVGWNTQEIIQILGYDGMGSQIASSPLTCNSFVLWTSDS